MTVRGGFLGCCLIVASLASGCSDGASSVEPSPRDGAPATDLESEEDALLGATCDLTNARRYETMLSRSLECADVTASRGTWVARKIFADGPEDVRDRACRYTWRPNDGAGPDRESLDRATENALLTPSCARGLPQRVGASADETSEEPIAPMGGAVGCDVCGVLRDGKAWVIRPPGDFQRVRFRAYLNSPSGAIERSMLVTAESARTPSLVVQMPSPPTGRAWADGVLEVSGF